MVGRSNIFRCFLSDRTSIKHRREEGRGEEARTIEKRPYLDEDDAEATNTRRQDPTRVRGGENHRDEAAEGAAGGCGSWLEGGGGRIWGSIGRTVARIWAR